jgi:hypothetical protein
VVDRKQNEKEKRMAKKTREVRKNKDGSFTEKVRYAGGSGHDKTYKIGTWGDKVISRKTYSPK